MLAAAVEKMLRAGGKPAWQIALDSGCSLSHVYNIAAEIGVKTKRAARGENKLHFPPHVPRPVEAIRADLAGQLTGIIERFERQLRADRSSDQISG